MQYVQVVLGAFADGDGGGGGGIFALINHKRQTVVCIF